MGFEEGIYLEYNVGILHQQTFIGFMGKLKALDAPMTGMVELHYVPTQVAPGKMSMEPRLIPMGDRPVACGDPTKLVKIDHDAPLGKAYLGLMSNIILANNVPQNTGKVTLK